MISTKTNKMDDLFADDQSQVSGPVTCLGLDFPSDSLRREHFLKILSAHLDNPEFWMREGFPKATKESILALSDPPYYTACPNPFVSDYIDFYTRQTELSGAYSKEPFFSDVSEGKYDPLYKLHPYHTKVPHRAIMRYILQYTEPGDFVQDIFSGSGATGVAAQLCGNREVVESLGYKVDADGVVCRSVDVGGETSWVKFSKIGERKAVLSDLSPVAAFISYLYNTPTNLVEFEREAKAALKAVESKYGWVYQTLHQPTAEQVRLAAQVIESEMAPKLSEICAVGRVSYTVWSDVFVCPECAGDVVFWSAAVDIDGGKVNDKFSCPSCGVSLTKRSVERKWRKLVDPYLDRVVEQAVQVPVMISYKVDGKRFQKVPDAADLALIAKTESLRGEEWCPTFELPVGFNTRQPIESHGLTHIHHFYTGRNRLALASFRSFCKSPMLNSLLTTVAFRITKRYGLTYQAGVWGAGGGPTNGTLYIPSLVKDLNILDMIDNAVGKSEAKVDIRSREAIISTHAAQSLIVKPNSIDYAFIDPPFGSNIMYSELNALWEGWLGVVTNPKAESIESKAQSKSLDDYRRMMAEGLKSVYVALKPGRWVTVEFSNTQASVWNAIQTALQEAGFVVANVAALDKQKGSFKAITTTTAVKQDLVISAYKPNQQLEEGLLHSGGVESSVWDFVRAHLKYLPRVKMKGAELEFISERDPRIIFDRMVAWFVRHGIPVPMSTHEFQAGLLQKFVDRDGMIFLPEQVAEYDHCRQRTSSAPQMEMFVSDERSAISWLSDCLKRAPSTYQEIHTDFLVQLGAGWKKHESRPELLALLEDNFLKYDGVGPVPSQISEYLAAQSLVPPSGSVNGDVLVTLATDRWFVPDPNKAQDLEKKREKALLKEFDGYVAATGRKLKEFRLEVLRAGFKTAWASRDYQTIIKVAQKIPEDALQEDEKLLLWYDQALTRADAAS